MATVSFHPIKPEEIEEARSKCAQDLPWAAEPQWDGVWILRDNGEMGFFGLQTRRIVEPLYGDSPRITRSLIDRADTLLIANGIRNWEFFVPDVNPKFQQTLERHYGLEGKRQLPGKYYFITSEEIK